MLGSEYGKWEKEFWLGCGRIVQRDSAGVTFIFDSAEYTRHSIFPVADQTKKYIFPVELTKNWFSKKIFRDKLTLTEEMTERDFQEKLERYFGEVLNVRSIGQDTMFNIDK